MTHGGRRKFAFIAMMSLVTVFAMSGNFARLFGAE